jgi:hypothetical protein
MRNYTVRYLLCILGAWIVPGSTVLSFPAFAAPRPPVSVTTKARYGLDLAVVTPASVGLRSCDGKLILDDRDRLGPDAPALTGVERSQTIAAVGFLPRQRVPVSVHVSDLHSTFVVEPRFLRYRHLHKISSSVFGYTAGNGYSKSMPVRGKCCRVFNHFIMRT